MNHFSDSMGDPKVFDKPKRGRPRGAANIGYPDIQFGHDAPLIAAQLKQQGFTVAPRQTREWQRLIDAVKLLRRERVIDVRHAQSTNYRICKRIDAYIREQRKQRGN